MAVGKDTGSTKPPRKPRPRLIGDLLTLAVIFGLLSAVYLLPADTSLAEIRKAGRIVACMPPSYPPLVTGNREAPGFDVELLREISTRLGLTLSIATNQAIGTDFNPRNWRVSRAQCQILAGGVVLSRDVRSFLDTVPTPLQTGWAVVSPAPITSLEGLTVGFYDGLTGLDRIGLGRYLRSVGAKVRIVQNIPALQAGIESGEFAAGVSEALGARQLAGANEWTVQAMPEELARFPLGFGIWRGDLTLLQAITGTMDQLQREGFIGKLTEKYQIAPIEGTIGEPG